MDLVSIDTQQEYDWIKGFMDGNVPYFWTSGRLCDFGKLWTKLILERKNVLFLRRLWPTWSLPQEHQRLVLVRHPVRHAAHQLQPLLPRLVTHGRPGGASARQQGGDSAPRRHGVLHGRPQQLLRRRWEVRVSWWQMTPTYSGVWFSIKDSLINVWGEASSLPRPLLRPPLTPLLQASSGTTWPAHTRSPSSARTWTATSPTPGSTSLRSEYLETSHYSQDCLGRSQSRKTIYLWDLGWNLELVTYSTMYCFFILSASLQPTIKVDNLTIYLTIYLFGIQTRI